MDTTTVRVGTWDNRKKQFIACEMDLVALEAWRNTPGHIHFAEHMRAIHDTTGLDYDRPVRTTVESTKIGQPLAQGVVADKRLIAGRVEYLLKPHTKASRKQWEDGLRRKRIAEIERMLQPGDDYRQRDDAQQLRDEQARLRSELDPV